MRRLDSPLVLALGVLVVAGCSRAPTRPTAPAAPDSGSVAGVVVRTQDDVPIAGATVMIDRWEATTDADGRFALSGLPIAGQPTFSIAAAGYLNRQTHVRLDVARSGVVVDLIPDSAPFLIEFYRQIARNAAESTTGLEPLRRWTVNPSFYFKTSHDPSGETVPAAVIEHIETIFANSVRELSGGRFRVAAFETGEAARPPADGWVNVLFQSTLANPNAAGTATVGGNQGTIWLRYDPADPQLFADDPSGCYSRVVQVAAHEILHTMGYWHPTSAYAPLAIDRGCTGSDWSAEMRYHAAVMYSRPPGNRDPDTDPSVFYFATSGGPRPPIVSCELPTPDE
jgi:hypothetical protein